MIYMLFMLWRDIVSLTDHEIQKLVEVAKMYYEENKTQDEIAKGLGVSRPLVSKLLARAREYGIVNIQIKSPFMNNNLLLDQLKSLFHLKGGIVVPEGSAEFLTEKMIINSTVNFLTEHLGNVNKLGIGWGDTVGELIARIEEESLGEFGGVVCPLTGTASFPLRGYHPNELVRVFSEKSGMHSQYLMAPAFPSSEQEYALFRNTENFKEVSALWDTLDAVVIGIGSHPSVPDHATALRFGTKLSQEKAVGNVLSYFYNSNGLFIDGENDYVIRISLEQLRKIKSVIAVGSADASIASIVGALRSGYITHLITDEKTAQDIVKYK